MTRLLVFLILSLSFAVSVQAQKVHRAAKAMYELKFDKELTENDKVFEDNKVKIAVEKKGNFTHYPKAERQGFHHHPA